MHKKITVLTGAGISAESGIKTFRDAGGLWEGHEVMKVASPEGWRSDIDLVLEFYNQRRKQLKTVIPNEAHHALVELEKAFEVCIVTQNIDDLHERAGSKNIIHLHGELLKSRSTLDEQLIYECPGDIKIGDLCQKGSQLRPHIVWFGEMVPMLEHGINACITSDIIMIIGTSMQVYPAASLVSYAKHHCEIYYIDPKPKLSFELSQLKNLTIIPEVASTGVPTVVKQLLNDHV